MLSNKNENACILSHRVEYNSSLTIQYVIDASSKVSSGETKKFNRGNMLVFFILISVTT